MREWMDSEMSLTTDSYLSGGDSYSTAEPQYYGELFYDESNGTQQMESNKGTELYSI